MGFVKFFLSSGVYFAAIVGIFTLLPLFQNVTFTKFSVTPQRPLTGPLELNDKLSGISKLFEDKLKGPEGLLYHNNTLYLSLHFGHVVKVVDNQLIPVVKFGKLCDGLHEEHICGRPLGLSMDKKGFLYVADAYYGIFKVNVNSNDQYGAKEQLVSMDEIIDGVRPKIPNSVVPATDGAIYWTDSDSNFKLHDGLYTMFVDGTGRLLKYNPETKRNTVLIKNLQFANGIEISDDESFLLIAETGKYRIQKYYIKGPNAGKSEIFIDGLPGMPDNIKRIGKFYYIPLVHSRVPGLESIGEYPAIRMMVVKFFSVLDFTFQTIDSFFPNLYCKKAAHWVGHFESSSIIHTFVKQRLSILKMNAKGTILSSWHSTDGKVFGICDIEVIDDKLYFGSPYNTFLGVLNVPRGFL